MNELTTNRTADIIAAEINGIKAQTRTMLLCSSIEIGRRLVEAKGMVEHGQWGEWLGKSVDYQKSTANNLMRIFEEYGADQIPLFGDNSKLQAFGSLTYSQAVALLGVPADDREKFIEENNLEEMSTRELQAAIKERDELQRKLDSSKKFGNDVAEKYNKLREETTDLQDKASSSDRLFRKEQETVKMLQGELEKERRRTKDEVARLVKLLEDARAEGRSEEDVKALTDKLDDAQRQVEELTQKLQQPVTVEPVIVEKIPEDIERELEELRKQKQDAQADTVNPAILRFGIHFESVVTGFQALLKDLGDIGDPEHAKYQAAVSGLLGKMSERVS